MVNADTNTAAAINNPSVTNNNTLTKLNNLGVYKCIGSIGAISFS